MLELPTSYASGKASTTRRSTSFSGFTTWFSSPPVYRAGLLTRGRMASSCSWETLILRILIASATGRARRRGEDGIHSAGLARPKGENYDRRHEHQAVEGVVAAIHP